MNKINGQAVTKRDPRGKKAARKIRNEVQSNNITPEMIAAGARAFEAWERAVNLGPDFPYPTYVRERLLPSVFLAMFRASKSHAL